MNSIEERFKEEAIKRGYNVYRSGYPDFMITKNRRIYGVEVKRRGQDLSFNQRVMTEVLESAGINTFISHDGEWINLEPPTRKAKTENQSLKNLINAQEQIIRQLLERVCEVEPNQLALSALWSVAYLKGVGIEFVNESRTGSGEGPIKFKYQRMHRGRGCNC